jgi:hypothetical protein
MPYLITNLTDKTYLADPYIFTAQSTEEVPAITPAIYRLINQGILSAGPFYLSANPTEEELETQLQFQRGAALANIPMFDNTGALINPQTLAPVTTGGSSGSVPSYLGVVASRCKILNFNVTGSGMKHIQTRSRHVAKDRITKPALVYSSVYSTVEALASLGTATVEAAIEYPVGTITRVTFSGANQGTVPNGQNLESDRITLPTAIPIGAVFFVRTYVIWNGTDSAYIRDSLAYNYPNSGETCEYSSTALTNSVMGGTIGTNGNFLGITYRPSAIVDTTSKVTFFLAGDSRVQANYPADFNRDVDGGSGEIESLLGGKFALINAAVSGDSYFNVTQAGRYARRLDLAKYCSHIIDEYGINDPSITQAQFKAYTVTFSNLFGGKPYYRTTITPSTTSTDQWTTLSGQTVGATAGNVISINQGIRAGDGPHSGYFDIASAVSSSRDSGLWRVDGIRTVTDATTTNGNLVITSATAAFTQADVGKYARVQKFATISTQTGSGTVVTVTTTANHGFSTGDVVKISGSNISGYNTNESSTNFGATITVTGATTFTYPSTATGSGTQGTVYRNRSVGHIRSVQSATQCTIGNLIGSTNTATDSGLYMAIGIWTQDGLHGALKTDEAIENSNAGRNLINLA